MANTVTKPDLIKHVAAEAGLSKADATKAADAALSFFTDALERGDTIQFRGAFTISSTETVAREGRNPRTGEKVMIPAGRRYKIKVAKGASEE